MRSNSDNVDIFLHAPFEDHATAAAAASAATRTTAARRRSSGNDHHSRLCEPATVPLLTERRLAYSVLTELGTNAGDQLNHSDRWSSQLGGSTSALVAFCVTSPPLLSPPSTTLSSSEKTSKEREKRHQKSGSKGPLQRKSTQGPGGHFFASRDDKGQGEDNKSSEQQDINNGDDDGEDEEGCTYNTVKVCRIANGCELFPPIRVPRREFGDVVGLSLTRQFLHQSVLAERSQIGTKKESKRQQSSSGGKQELFDVGYETETAEVLPDTAVTEFCLLLATCSTGNVVCFAFFNAISHTSPIGVLLSTPTLPHDMSSFAASSTNDHAQNSSSPVVANFNVCRAFDGYVRLDPSRQSAHISQYEEEVSDAAIRVYALLDKHVATFKLCPTDLFDALTVSSANEYLSRKHAEGRLSFQQFTASMFPSCDAKLEWRCAGMYSTIETCAASRSLACLCGGCKATTIHIFKRGGLAVPSSSSSSNLYCSSSAQAAATAAAVDGGANSHGYLGGPVGSGQYAKYAELPDDSYQQPLRGTGRRFLGDDDDDSDDSDMDVRDDEASDEERERREWERRHALEQWDTTKDRWYHRANAQHVQAPVVRMAWKSFGWCSLLSVVMEDSVCTTPAASVGVDASDAVSGIGGDSTGTTRSQMKRRSGLTITLPSSGHQQHQQQQQQDGVELSGSGNADGEFGVNNDSLFSCGSNMEFSARSSAEPRVSVCHYTLTSGSGMGSGGTSSASRRRGSSTNGASPLYSNNSTDYYNNNSSSIGTTPTYFDLWEKTKSSDSRGQLYETFILYDKTSALLAHMDFLPSRHSQLLHEYRCEGITHHATYLSILPCGSLLLQTWRFSQLTSPMADKGYRHPKLLKPLLDLFGFVTFFHVTKYTTPWHVSYSTRSAAESMGNTAQMLAPHSPAGAGGSTGGGKGSASSNAHTNLAVELLIHFSSGVLLTYVVNLTTAEGHVASFLRYDIVSSPPALEDQQRRPERRQQPLFSVLRPLPFSQPQPQQPLHGGIVDVTCRQHPRLPLVVCVVMNASRTIDVLLWHTRPGASICLHNQHNSGTCESNTNNGIVSRGTASAASAGAGARSFYSSSSPLSFSAQSNREASLMHKYEGLEEHIKGRVVGGASGNSSSSWQSGGKGGTPSFRELGSGAVLMHVARFHVSDLCTLNSSSKKKNKKKDKPPTGAEAGGEGKNSAGQNGQEKTLQQRINAVVDKYCPEKARLTPALLKACNGDEQRLLTQLVTKYGPEPDGSSKEEEEHRAGDEDEGEEKEEEKIQLELVRLDHIDFVNDTTFFLKTNRDHTITFSSSASAAPASSSVWTGFHLHIDNYEDEPSFAALSGSVRNSKNPITSNLRGAAASPDNALLLGGELAECPCIGKLYSVRPVPLVSSGGSSGEKTEGEEERREILIQHVPVNVVSKKNENSTMVVSVCGFQSDSIDLAPHCGDSSSSLSLVAVAGRQFWLQNGIVEEQEYRSQSDEGEKKDDNSSPSQNNNDSRNKLFRYKRTHDTLLGVAVVATAKDTNNNKTSNEQPFQQEVDAATATASPQQIFVAVLHLEVILSTRRAAAASHERLNDFATSGTSLRRIENRLSIEGVRATVLGIVPTACKRNHSSSLDSNRDFFSMQLFRGSMVLLHDDQRVELWKLQPYVFHRKQMNNNTQAVSSSSHASSGSMRLETAFSFITENHNSSSCGAAAEQWSSGTSDESDDDEGRKGMSKTTTHPQPPTIIRVQISEVNTFALSNKLVVLLSAGGGAVITIESRVGRSQTAGFSELLSGRIGCHVEHTIAPPLSSENPEEPREEGELDDDDDELFESASTGYSPTFPSSPTSPAPSSASLSASTQQHQQHRHVTHATASAAIWGISDVCFLFQDAGIAPIMLLPRDDDSRTHPFLKLTSGDAGGGAPAQGSSSLSTVGSAMQQQQQRHAIEDGPLLFLTASSRPFGTRRTTRRSSSQQQQQQQQQEGCEVSVMSDLRLRSLLPAGLDPSASATSRHRLAQQPAGSRTTATASTTTAAAGIMHYHPDVLLGFVHEDRWAAVTQVLRALQLYMSERARIAAAVQRIRDPSTSGSMSPGQPLPPQGLWALVHRPFPVFSASSSKGSSNDKGSGSSPSNRRRKSAAEQLYGSNESGGNTTNNNNDGDGGGMNDDDNNYDEVTPSSVFDEVTKAVLPIDCVSLTDLFAHCMASQAAVCAVDSGTSTTTTATTMGKTATATTSAIDAKAAIVQALEELAQVVTDDFIANLSDTSLPNLSSAEQLHLVAIVQSIHSLLATAGAAATKSGSSGSSASVDVDVGALHFLLPFYLHNISRRLRLASFCAELPPQGVCWALSTDAQEDLVKKIGARSAKSSSSSLSSSPALSSAAALGNSWDECRAFGFPLWVRSPILLRSICESLAKAQFAVSRDPRSCALMYILLNKRSVLASLCKAANEERLQAFFLRDFANDKKSRDAAGTNAFAAMGKGNLELACAFFALAEQHETALDLLIQRNGDWTLAVLVARLAYNDDPEKLSKLMLRVVAARDSRTQEEEEFAARRRSERRHSSINNNNRLSFPLSTNSKSASISTTATSSSTQQHRQHHSHHHQHHHAPDFSTTKLNPPLDAWYLCALLWRCGKHGEAIAALHTLNDPQALTFARHITSTDPTLVRRQDEVLPLAMQFVQKFSAVRHHVSHNHLLLAAGNMLELREMVHRVRLEEMVRRGDEENGSSSSNKDGPTMADEQHPAKKEQAPVADFNTGQLQMFGMDGFSSSDEDDDDNDKDNDKKQEQVAAVSSPSTPKNAEESATPATTVRSNNTNNTTQPTRRDFDVQDVVLQSDIASALVTLLRLQRRSRVHAYSFASVRDDLTPSQQRKSKSTIAFAMSLHKDEAFVVQCLGIEKLDMGPVWGGISPILSHITVPPQEQEQPVADNNGNGNAANSSSNSCSARSGENNGSNLTYTMSNTSFSTELILSSSKYLWFKRLVEMSCNETVLSAHAALAHYNSVRSLLHLTQRNSLISRHKRLLDAATLDLYRHIEQLFVAVKLSHFCCEAIRDSEETTLMVLSSLYTGASCLATISENSSLLVSLFKCDFFATMTSDISMGPTADLNSPGRMLFVTSSYGRILHFLESVLTYKASMDSKFFVLTYAAEYGEGAAENTTRNYLVRRYKHNETELSQLMTSQSLLAFSNVLRQLVALRRIPTSTVAALQLCFASDCALQNLRMIGFHYFQQQQQAQQRQSSSSSSPSPLARMHEMEAAEENEECRVPLLLVDTLLFELAHAAAVATEVTLAPVLTSLESAASRSDLAQEYHDQRHNNNNNNNNNNNTSLTGVSVRSLSSSFPKSASSPMLSIAASPLTPQNSEVILPSNDERSRALCKALRVAYGSLLRQTQRLPSTNLFHATTSWLSGCFPTLRESVSIQLSELFGCFDDATEALQAMDDGDVTAHQYSLLGFNALRESACMHSVMLEHNVSTAAYRQQLTMRGVEEGTFLHDIKELHSIGCAIYSSAVDSSTFDNLAFATTKGIMVKHGLRDALMADDCVLLDQTQQDRIFATMNFARTLEAAHHSPLLLPAQSRLSTFGKTHLEGLSARAIIAHPHLPVFVAGGVDGSISTHQFGTHELTGMFRDATSHRGVAKSIVFSPNGYTMTCADNIGVVAVWRFGTDPTCETPIYSSDCFQDAKSVCYLNSRTMVIAAVGHEGAPSHKHHQQHGNIVGSQSTTATTTSTRSYLQSPAMVSIGGSANSMMVNAAMSSNSSTESTTSVGLHHPYRSPSPVGSSSGTQQQQHQHHHHGEEALKILDCLLKRPVFAARLPHGVDAWRCFHDTATERISVLGTRGEVCIFDIRRGTWVPPPSDSSSSSSATPAPYHRIALSVSLDKPSNRGSTTAANNNNNIVHGNLTAVAVSQYSDSGKLAVIGTNEGGIAVFHRASFFDPALSGGGSGDDDVAAAAAASSSVLLHPIYEMRGVHKKLGGFSSTYSPSNLISSSTAPTGVTQLALTPSSLVSSGADGKILYYPLVNDAMRHYFS